MQRALVIYSVLMNEVTREVAHTTRDFLLRYAGCGKVIKLQSLDGFVFFPSFCTRAK